MLFSLQYSGVHVRSVSNIRKNIESVHLETGCCAYFDERGVWGDELGGATGLNVRHTAKCVRGHAAAPTESFPTVQGIFD
jgi:hypothetical protein